MNISKPVIAFNYNMALYINSRRKTGILEVEFWDGGKVCYKFSVVENIKELIEEYNTQKYILELVEDIARMAQ